MRRILSAILTVLGLVAIALAVCSATIWKPSSTVEASLAQSPNQPYVITEPGVLGTLGSDVTVTATAEGGQEVRVIVARATDIHAWLDSDPYVSITGVSVDGGLLDSHEVTEKCGTQDGAAAGDPSGDQAGQQGDQAGQGGCTTREASGADPADSDLWITEHTGSGSVTFEQSAADAQVVVMAVTDGTADAPSLTLSWPRTVGTPWYFYAGVVLGGLLVLVGVFLFVLDVQMRHAEAQRRARAAERAARVARADGVATASIPQLDDPDRKLTRRELREKDRAESAGEEWTDPRTGRVYRGGVEVPGVPSAPVGALDGSGAWRPGAAAGLPAAAGTQGSEPVAGDAGAARGSAVLPGLDETTTQAHRAARDLSGEPAFSVAATDSKGSSMGPMGPMGSMEASTAEVPAFDDAADHSRFAPSWQGGAPAPGQPGDLPGQQAGSLNGLGQAPAGAFHDPAAQPAQPAQTAQSTGHDAVGLSRPSEALAPSGTQGGAVGQQGPARAWGQQAPDSSWDQDPRVHNPRSDQAWSGGAGRAGEADGAGAPLAGGPGWPQPAQSGWGESAQQSVQSGWGESAQQSVQSGWGESAQQTSQSAWGEQAQPAWAPPQASGAAHNPVTTGPAVPATPVGFDAAHGAPAAPQAPGAPVGPQAPAYPAAPAAATGDAWTMPGASGPTPAQDAGHGAEQATGTTGHGPWQGAGQHWPTTRQAPAQEAHQEPTHGRHALQEAPDLAARAGTPGGHAAPAVPSAPAAPTAPGPGAALTGAPAAGSAAAGSAGAQTGAPVVGAPTAAAPANPYLGAEPGMGPGTTGMMGPGTTGMMGPGATSAPPADAAAQGAPSQPGAPAAGEPGVEDYRVPEEEVRAANAVPLTTENPTDKERS